MRPQYRLILKSAAVTRNWMRLRPHWRTGFNFEARRYSGIFRGSAAKDADTEKEYRYRSAHFRRSTVANAKLASIASEIQTTYGGAGQWAGAVNG
jgi:hypothetical protein